MSGHSFTTRLFDTLRTQILLVVEFKSRDLPKRLLTSGYLAAMLLLYANVQIACLFYTSILCVELARLRIFRRLPKTVDKISDRQVAGILVLDVIATTAYCLPSLGLVASGSITGLILGALWLSAVTLHNVSGLAMVKVWCWAALVPVVLTNAATVWITFQSTFDPPSGWDAWVIALGMVIYATNTVEVTLRQRQNRNAFADAQRAAHERLMQLEYLATHDALTGLMNRTAFDEGLADIMLLTDNVENAGVIMIDLDGFKGVNDTFGHAAGDAVLVEVARRIRDWTGPDRGARLGGDEFAILLRGDLQQMESIAVAEGLHKALQADVEFEGEKLAIGASMGIAFRRPRDDSASKMCSRADRAMYNAKSSRIRRPVIAEARNRSRPRSQSAG